MRALPALLLAAALLAACGTAKTPPRPPAAAAVDVDVTAGWGAEEIAHGPGPPAKVATTTRAVTPIETTYGGRYVSSIGGRAGDGTSEWIFWINGIEAAVGAADIAVAPGDVVWWDLHRWAGRTHVPAVIASWPMPLAGDLRSNGGAVTADPPLAAALTASGLAVSAPAGTAGPRAIVGASAVLVGRDTTWRTAVADPAAAGLTAWIDGSGVVRVWDAARASAIVVPSATAVIVATTEGFSAEGAPVFVVAGTTAKAAAQAAALLVADPGLVRHQAAICLDATGRIVCSGGRGRTP